MQPTVPAPKRKHSEKRRRTHMVGVRMDDVEYELLAAVAARRGQSLPRYLREAAILMEAAEHLTKGGAVRWGG